MKYIPRLPQENVNVSQTSPLKELFFLLATILGILLFIYIVLGILVNVLIARAPAKIEKVLEVSLSKPFLTKEQTPTEQKVQQLLDSLVKFMPAEEQRKYTVHIIPKQEANALALPGGHIIIFSGLLKEVKSENELAMILAHELGHFVHKDHLRQLGRNLILVLLLSIILGPDNSIVEAFQPMIMTAEYKFSRNQETAADKFALELVYKKYGHVGGAFDFFQKVEKKRNLPKFLRYFSTHPFPQERIKILEEIAQKKGYPIKKVIPLHLEISKAVMNRQK